MKLVNMKVGHEEVKDVLGTDSDSEYSPPKYPYGLTIHLDTDSIDILGLDLSDFGVGDKVVVQAVANVESLREEERTSGKNTKNISLQITDIQIQQQQMELDIDEAAVIDSVTQANNTSKKGSSLRELLRQANK